MITPAQLRAARGLLDWGRRDLKAACGVSAETIKNIEHGNFAPHADTLDKIVKAFADHGVGFLGLNFPDAAGVVLVARQINERTS